MGRSAAIPIQVKNTEKIKKKSVGEGGFSKC